MPEVTTEEISSASKYIKHNKTFILITIILIIILHTQYLRHCQEIFSKIVTDRWMNDFHFPNVSRPFESDYTVW